MKRAAIILPALLMTLMAHGPRTKTWVHFELDTAANTFLDRFDEVEPLLDRPLTASDMPRLARWYRVQVDANRAGAERYAAMLREDPRVVTAFAEPIGLPASFNAKPNTACPIKTPSYEPYQAYLAEAPAGINAPVAWAYAGGRGENVAFADVEGGWRATHEDLPTERIENVAGRPVRDGVFEPHGTAVVGVVASKDNRIGMVGIAPDVKRIVTASIIGTSIANAIDKAQAALEPGDVLLIELHTPGPRRRWLPMEWYDDVFAVVKNATERGVIVVAAAGNGGEDLDRSTYKKKFDRNHRDSGAILVGAGAPPKPGYVDRSRLAFSNYGSRVDVQGWGYHVATTGYGDLQGCAEKERKYTAAFGGTSSASPIVTGAAILLQSIARARSGRPLEPLEMRALLTRTGTPQVDGPNGPATWRIGPRPDLARAIPDLFRDRR